MGRGVFVVATLVVGCGRIGFDSETTADSANDATADTVNTVMPAGCVLHLAMEEASWNDGGLVQDSCGTNHGTAGGGARTAFDAVRGNVGEFVGDTSCVFIPDAPSLRIADQLTTSAWIHPTQLAPNSFGVISKRIDVGVSTEYSLFLWTDNDGTGNTNHVYVDIDTENDRIDDPNATYLDTWRQITVVYDGRLPDAQRTTFYVDGVSSFVTSETSATVVTPPTVAQLAIGCLPLSGPAQSMVGFLDDVVIWQRALAASEVAAWYDASRR